MYEKKIENILKYLYGGTFKQCKKKIDTHCSVAPLWVYQLVLYWWLRNLRWWLHWRFGVGVIDGPLEKEKYSDGSRGETRLSHFGRLQGARQLPASLTHLHDDRIPRVLGCLDSAKRPLPIKRDKKDIYKGRYQSVFSHDSKFLNSNEEFCRKTGYIHFGQF